MDPKDQNAHHTIAHHTIWAPRIKTHTTPRIKTHTTQKNYMKACSWVACIPVHVCVHVNKRTHTQPHTHAHTHARTHTRTHTHIQASQSKSWDTSDLKDLSGKVLLVTGANAGIGLEVAKELARRSGIVHMLCRCVCVCVCVCVCLCVLVHMLCKCVCSCSRLFAHIILGDVLSPY